MPTAATTGYTSRRPKGVRTACLSTLTLTFTSLAIYPSVVKGLSQGVELLEFYKDPDDSEWFFAKLACNGVLSVGFSVPTPTVYDLLKQGEPALAAYLESNARSLIERYGDGRDPRPDPALLSNNAA